MLTNVAGLLLFYLCGFLLARLLTVRMPVLSRHPIVVHALVLLAGASLFLELLLPDVPGQVVKWARVGVFFCLMTLALRLLDVLVFELVRPRRGSASVPKVVRDILRWVLSLAGLMVIVRVVFPQADLNVLAFSSIVVGYILGNASQDTLGNLISGLALNTESPFSIGDWVEIAGHRGRVVDMTWRATRLRTRLDDYIILPNAVISRDPIINFSRPTQVHGIKLPVGVNYDVPPNTVRRALLEVMRSVPAVLDMPAPEVRLKAYSDFSIDYEMRFFMRDYRMEEVVKSAVMDRVWYVFKREGIVIPFPIRDVNIRQVSAEEERRQSAQRIDARRSLLDRVDLFGPLSDAERQRVAESLVSRIYADGEVLVREGEKGGSFFLLEDGEVQVTRGNGAVLANLCRGDVFGEISLLTGERCNATVSAVRDTRVLVLSHEVLRGLLEANEELAEALAEVVASRQSAEPVGAPDPARDQLPPGPPKATILSGMRRFFGISI